MKTYTLNTHELRTTPLLLLQDPVLPLKPASDYERSVAAITFARALHGFGFHQLIGNMVDDHAYFIWTNAPGPCLFPFRRTHLGSHRWVPAYQGSDVPGLNYHLTREFLVSVLEYHGACLGCQGKNCQYCNGIGIDADLWELVMRRFSPFQQFSGCTFEPETVMVQPSTNPFPPPQCTHGSVPASLEAQIGIVGFSLSELFSAGVIGPVNVNGVSCTWDGQQEEGMTRGPLGMIELQRFGGRQVITLENVKSYLPSPSGVMVVTVDFTMKNRRVVSDEQRGKRSDRGKPKQAPKRAEQYDLLSQRYSYNPEEWKRK